MTEQIVGIGVFKDTSDTSTLTYYIIEQETGLVGCINKTDNNSFKTCVLTKTEAFKNKLQEVNINSLSKEDYLNIAKLSLFIALTWGPINNC